MKKIKKHTRIIGKVDNKRIKTTASKWLKLMDKKPKSIFSFKEDEEETKKILLEENEKLEELKELLTE